MSPLQGIRVLDLSRLLPGPFLTGLLAELGAEVVKVEAPGVGDDTRHIPPDLDGAGYAFTATNRGKRSIAIDLKRPGAAELVLRLAARSDVLVESFRPGVMDRFGLADAVLARANPRLVRCSLVGYGPGPYRDDVGHDLNYQALAGLVHANGARPPSAQVADLGGALYASTGILAALLERASTGRGARIEVALGDAAVAFNTLSLTRAKADTAGGTASDTLVDTAAEAGWELTGTLPCYRTYRCADGRHVALACLEHKFWLRFCEATGVDEALQYDRDAAAHATLEALFLRSPSGKWVDELRKASVPITPVLAPGEVGVAPTPAWPLTRARASAPSPPHPAQQPHPAQPARPRPPPPGLGADTDDVLREAGYDDASIARLREDGTVA